MRSNPRQSRSEPWLALWPRGFGPALGQALNLAFNAAAVLVLVLATVTVLAQMALPGNALYGWKITSEQAWRAVHFDPFKTDLLLTGRRVSELAQVADDPQAAEVARLEYQQALTTLSEYDSPDSQEIISDTLVEQKEILDKAGVRVPELDSFLPASNNQQMNLLLDNRVESVENDRITYTLTITNAGPASPVTATLTSNLAPEEKFVSASDASCQESSTGTTVTCTLDNLATTAPRMLKLTTAINPCYAGVVTQTTRVTGPGNVINSNINSEAAALSTITAPYPRPAAVAYVQSNNDTHDMGLVSSENRILNGILHRWAAAPAWSPDGTRLAFFGEPGISDLSSVYSQGNGVWVVDVVDAQAQEPWLLIAQDHIKNIVWSPDGSKLAFEVGPPNIAHEVVVVDSRDGQTISRFPGEQPAWSPDSKKLVIKSCGSECGLWLVNLDGSDGQQLTFVESDSYPAWSPAGEYLAFASERDQDWEIYLLRLADGELQRLTRRPGTDTTPVFGPCGQNLYLRTDSYGSWWITVMKLDGSDERKVQEGVGFSDDWGLARPAVH
jgi:uncharacterized repeat protein (TIGR01451 family)